MATINPYNTSEFNEVQTFNELRNKIMEYDKGMFVCDKRTKSYILSLIQNANSFYADNKVMNEENKNIIKKATQIIGCDSNVELNKKNKSTQPTNWVKSLLETMSNKKQKVAPVGGNAFFKNQVSKHNVTTKTKRRKNKDTKRRHKRAKKVQH